MGVRRLSDDDGQYDEFGGSLIDVPPPDLPFTDEQYRRDALYSHPEFIAYLGPTIINAPFSAQTKRATNIFAASNFNRAAILGYNKSLSDAMEDFRLELVELKTRFTPRDVRIPEYAALMSAFESYYKKMISRTVGGPLIRERMLQHGQHVTQRVEQVATPTPPREPQENKIWDV